MLIRNDAGQNYSESVMRESMWLEGFVKRSWSERVMAGESGESMAENQVTGVPGVGRRDSQG